MKTANWGHGNDGSTNFWELSQGILVGGVDQGHPDEDMCLQKSPETA